MSTPSQTSFRALSPTGELQIRTRGRPAAPLQDLFHHLLTLSWPRFLVGTLLAWLAVNVGFSLLYLLDPGGITNSGDGSFADAFFFSVQTLSTIGYGGMAPTSAYAHVVVSVEAFSGMLCTALITGLMFAKFSRPAARVLFTSRAVIASRNGVPCFMVRIANARDHGVIGAKAQALLVHSGETAEGEPIRRFERLVLERAETPVFSLTWTLVHPITPESPLHGHDASSLDATAAEIMIVVSGIDETIAQPVSIRRSYVGSEIEWGQRFADMLSRCPDGGALADYARFDDLVANE